MYLLLVCSSCFPSVDCTSHKSALATRRCSVNEVCDRQVGVRVCSLEEEDEADHKEHHISANHLLFHYCGPWQCQLRFIQWWATLVSTSTSNVFSSAMVCGKGLTTCMFLNVMRPVTTKAAVMACTEAEMQVRLNTGSGFTKGKYMV